MAIPDVLLIDATKFGDSRGFFSETYNQGELAALGLHATFVQDNQSLSAETGVIRGMHFQIPPVAQAKLVRVIRGSILDVAVDIRRGSPTFGRHVSAVISAEAWNQIFVPEGFAHGFCTLEPATEVIYKVSAPYSPEHDRGIAFDDPALAIEWPVEPANALLSAKDRALPRLADLQSFFLYDGTSR